ncbi:MAG TPA: class I SAM-dependent methyltransferase [Phycisphaerae bacterium]|jgi:hypothetical protein|nr:class I SAM-dependent methyltransferase [Phycisphaerae bacterium]
MSLWQTYMNHTGRPCDKWSHYFPVYERHLAHFVGQPIKILEIGVLRGGSLQLWKSYFGPRARIAGIDIEPSSQYSEPQIDVFIGSQSDTAFLGNVLDKWGVPDVVIDDGSHHQKDIHTTFNFLFPRMPNCVYIVEDLHTAYWSGYGGGLGNPGSFYETLKKMIDEVNKPHYVPSPATVYTMAPIHGIHIYDSMAVIEKHSAAPGLMSYRLTRPANQPQVNAPTGAASFTIGKGH